MSCQTKLSRREFIRDAAIGAVAVTSAGVVSTSPAQAQTGCALPGVPAQWDAETDVVVIGYGGAGAFAAIAAAEAGAKVVVLEKAPQEGGGNTRLSGANFTVTDNPDEAAKYLAAASGLATPADQIQAWAIEIAKTAAWFDKNGIKYTTMPAGTGADFKNLPGAASVKAVAVTGGGPTLFKATNKIVKDKGVQVMLNTPAKQLIQNPATHEILGVLADSQGKSVAIKAKRGVVLASGGFEYNDKMKNNYLRPETLKGVGWVYNTGDGIHMAQAAGADLWHMNYACSAGITVLTPDTIKGWDMPGVKANSYVQVDRFGARFICENPSPHFHRQWMYYDIWDWSQNQKDSGYKAIPSYLIFDETGRTAGPLWSSKNPDPAAILPAALGGPTSTWSKDNQAEIDKGIIKKGNTIEELAKAIGDDMDAAVLKTTIEKYNGYVKAGQDLELKRDPKSLAAIEKPPFYAVQVWPALFSTFGGPRKNAKAQVLDTNEKVLGRLYAAGTVSHSCSHLYSTFGQNMAENFAFGNIAGRNVAAEKPWDAT